MGRRAVDRGRSSQRVTPSGGLATVVGSDNGSERCDRRSTITAAAVRLGIGVYRPVMEGGRYDLVFDLGSRLVRVQCKWAPLRGDVLSVPLRSCRRGRDGFIRRTYTAEEIDAVAAYCQPVNRCFWLPIDLFAGSPEIRLRLAPTRNNQRRRINWADDFDFVAKLRSLGAVAQLGEH